MGNIRFQLFLLYVWLFSRAATAHKRIKFRANFFKNKRKAPLLDKDAYLFQLDGEEKQNIPSTHKH
ncbi:MAG: hypothetical protein R2822_18825 [Spirosomataceae bacterium]